jgi:hypothetical protein
LVKVSLTQAYWQNRYKLNKKIYVICIEKLSYFERKLSFLNPTWQVLKYFNEKQFFKIVQETSIKSHILGRLPKALGLPIHERHLVSECYSGLSSRSTNNSSSRGIGHQSNGDVNIYNAHRENTYSSIDSSANTTIL